ncbi:glycosyltransferase family 4 protein [Streptomyces roseicoloratus]|uniref:D-inositol 3-phosphate glycosyltransferase n=1 Tax=Streptomyces roseicoloratus TaxID=2508722 RepID=A0ABY9S1Q3_9ACTN|nr:glycosyltransferase family 4 protein [Streptomyces roseicoloratus]WMX48367.1 glycosyltransferase family 4 protein [Streptomyces roseicoloratus]
MSTFPRRPRVLLLTGGPLDGADGAGVRLASDVLGVLTDVEFTWFTRWPHRRGRPPPHPYGGHAVPMPSRDGGPRTPERVQSVLGGAVYARRCDLVHAFLTIGRAFPAFSWLRPLLLGARPVVHTLPGVTEPALLPRTRPLGTTVALSESMARRLRAADFGDVRVIPPMLPLEHWPSRPRPRGLPVVLYAGRHDPAGGAETAIDAAAEAVRAGAEFRLVLAMRGRPGQDLHSREEALRERAGAAGLRDVEVRGYVPDMPELIASAHVLLFPPTAIGGRSDIPLIVLEALATGRPVILSDLPQFADFGNAVLRAPAGDARRTGQQLLWLLDQPRSWDVLAERGRTAVEERFGPERFAARYAALYRELLA